MFRSLARTSAALPSVVARQSGLRSFSASSATRDKILMVLYDGDEASKEKRLLGCKENALGLRPWLEGLGHTVVTTSDKERAGSEFDKHLEDAAVVITTPFHPGYVNAERIAKAKNLKICITAGVGSDHVDLDAANSKNIGVYEVTGSNVTSVAEHVVMSILCLVRNFVPAHEMIKRGDWKVADVAKASWDVEGKVIGTVGSGRIGYRVLQRLVPFEPKELLYSDYQPLPKDLEAAVGARHVSLDELVAQCDIITINAPLTKETRGMFNKELLAKCKPGVFIVNTARGAIVDTQSLVDAVESGHVAGYAGDVWYPQPASRYHPWRIMPRHALTPHISGTTLDAQARYANGVKDILTRWFEGKEQQPQNIICEGGEIVSRAYSKTGKIETKAHVTKESY